MRGPSSVCGAHCATLPLDPLSDCAMNMTPASFSRRAPRAASPPSRPTCQLSHHMGAHVMLLCHKWTRVVQIRKLFPSNVGDFDVALTRHRMHECMNGRVPPFLAQSLMLKFL